MIGIVIRSPAVASDTSLSLILAVMRSRVAFLLLLVLLAASSYANKKQLNLMDLFGSLIQELKMRYFSGCSIVILYDTDTSFNGYIYNEGDDGQWKSQLDILLSYLDASARILLPISENLTEILASTNLNTITRCPVYLIISPNIGNVLDFFLLPNKDWDKYFLSRKIILFTESPKEDIISFLESGEMSTMTATLIVRPTLVSQRQTRDIHQQLMIDSEDMQLSLNFSADNRKSAQLKTVIKESIQHSLNFMTDNRESALPMTMINESIQLPLNLMADRGERASLKSVIPERIQYLLNSIEMSGLSTQLKTVTSKGILHSQNAIALSIATNRPYTMSSENILITLATYNGRPLTPEVDFFTDKLKDFFGHEMGVVTFHFPPRIFMIESDNNGEKEYQLYGVDIDVLNSVSEALNFTVIYSRPSDNEMWGWEQDDGNWTGLMGDLQNRRADIGVADLYIMEPYFAIIDMSIEYDIEYLCFVNLVPGPLPQWMALGLPFLMESWIAIGITILSGMVLFWVFARLSSLGRIAEDKSWFRNATNTSLLLFGAVMSTPWIRIPRASHLRIFLAVWSLAFIILAVAYKGSLVSYLTVPLQQPPIDTHKELLAKKIDVGSIGYTLKRVMEKNADQYVRQLAEKYQLVSSTSEGLQRTLEGTYSFLESRGFLDYTIAVYYTDRLGRPSLHAMREYIAPFGIGLAYPKYVPYVSKFNYIIRSLTEAGFAKKWMADIILRSKRARINSKGDDDSAPGKQDDDPPVSELAEDSQLVRPLTLDNLQGGFVILILLWLLGTSVFLTELLAGHVQKE